MKVKLRTTYVAGKGGCDVTPYGATIDLKKDEAQKLIERGLAEEITTPEPSSASVTQQDPPPADPQPPLV